MGRWLNVIERVLLAWTMQVDMEASEKLARAKRDSTRTNSSDSISGIHVSAIKARFKI